MKVKHNPLASLLSTAGKVLAVLIALEAALLLWISLPPTVGDSEVGLADFDDAPLRPTDTREDYAEATERALFNWNRRASPRGANRAEASTGELGSQWRLIGLVATSDSTYAIFNELDGDRQLRLEQGMKLQGWNLEFVDEEQAVMVNGDKRETFRLSVSENPHTDVGVAEDTQDQGEGIIDDSPAASTEESGQ